MVALNGNVRLVALQFRFTNPDAIPSTVRYLDYEAQEVYAERKSRSSGVMVIEPTENCSLTEFLGELEMAGFELVDALYQERPSNGKNNSKGQWTYHMVRYLFARHEFVELSDEFKKVRDDIRAALSKMCHVAMWCLQMYSNPFYENGEESPDWRAVSINLTARQPLFRPDGQPVTVWQKDESGERVGDTPLPLKPERRLRIENNAIQLM